MVKPKWENKIQIRGTRIIVNVVYCNSICDYLGPFYTNNNARILYAVIFNFNENIFNESFDNSCLSRYSEILILIISNM